MKVIDDVLKSKQAHKNCPSSMDSGYAELNNRYYALSRAQQFDDSVESLVYQEWRAVHTITAN